MLGEIVAGAVSFMLMVQAGPPPITVPGRGGTPVRAPRGRVDVYVPLDPALRSILAGEPVPSDWGFLRLDVRPDAALVSIDGRLLRSAAQPAELPPFLALAPGRHRIEIVLAGGRAVAATVEIAPGRTFVLQLELLQDPAQPAPESCGGYHVVPRR
jgi:hypothetical protein